MIRWLAEGVIDDASIVTQSHIDTYCLVFIMLAEIYNVIGLTLYDILMFRCTSKRQ